MNKVFSDLKLYMQRTLELANEIAELLELKLENQLLINSVRRNSASIWESVRDCDVYVVQPICTCQ